MADFDSAESIEEFKFRLNSLTERLNRINKNFDQASNKIEAVPNNGT